MNLKHSLKCFNANATLVCYHYWRSAAMIRTFFTALLFLFGSSVLAQDQDKVIRSFFKEVNPALLASTFPQNSIKASKYRIVAIDLGQLYAELESVPQRDSLQAASPIQIELP